MGVHGLWKLLEPVGKVVPLEGMAGKVLAVDVSIWLHQAMKGMHDAHGAPIAVAHLLILFHRLCKLLFYKIKPVFVFDGGVPALKRETMTTRRNQRTSARNEAVKVREKLLKNILKHEAVRQLLSHEKSSGLLGLSSLALPGSSTEEDLYKLPPVTEKPDEDRSDEEVSSEDDGEIKYAEDIHSIDVTSSDFKSLPPEVRHEILLELIETRKQSSWKNIDAMPKESDSFSDFQMSRLLKRRAVQSSLDEAGKEMGGSSMTMRELESLLLNDPLSLEKEDFLPSKRIAQSADARYLLLQKDDEELVKFLAEDAKNEESKDAVIEEQGCLDPQEDLKEVKKEELSQEEIYDLIQKENASKVTTKITKDRKMNLTEDVLEILPLLGEKGMKIESFGESSRMLTPDMIKVEKEEVESMEMENAEDSNEKYENHTSECLASESEIPKTTKSTRTDLEEAGENKLETITNVAQDSAELSEESDDDFVPVNVEEAEVASFLDVNLSAPIVKTKRNELEIVINTEKVNTNTDDIFSDIFDNAVETEKVPVQEKVAENDIESADSITFEGKQEIESVEEAGGDNDEKRISECDDSKIPKPEMTEKDLLQLQKTVEGECDDLMQEQWRQERYAQSISEQMNLDAQELLRLFGIPYVVAPMEAEAQCAILNTIGMTDGTITDDSDIWLFGGKVVYRNFFNQKKHVQQYKIEDIERYFKLSRLDLIRMAMLVGSDYTSGLEGVGPVTALEILGAFPCSQGGEILSGLRSFRDWVSSGHDTKRTLRKKIKNTTIIPGFPSEAVVEAYMHPQVDDSKEPFSWAKPNIPLLQKYAKIKFGWNQDRSNELLNPVMKKLNEKKVDTTIDKYFVTREKDNFVEGALSKRVEIALRRIRNEVSPVGSVEGDDSEPERKRKKRANKKNKTENPSSSKLEDSSSSQPRRNREVIPQKRAMEMVLEDRKKSAIKIFKQCRRSAKNRKAKIPVTDEVNLSESSSSSD